MPNPYEPPAAPLNQPEPVKRHLKAVELASHMLFRRDPDGRLLYRHWASRGTWYIVNERQRITRARIQVGFQWAGLGLTVIAVQYLSMLTLFCVLLPAELAIQFLLIALYSRGLSRTNPPAMPTTREQEREHLHERSRLIGKRRLWACLLGSLAFVVAGIAIALSGGPLGTAIGAILFFGVGAVVFIRQLRGLS
jgi:hypothetical protein